MPQSPELAGGEGFTLEGDVAAFYLAALLAEAYAPGIEDRTVIRVSVQQRDFGEPLDDVIVDFQDAAKDPARLSLQVKRSLTISNAETNTDFREIIRDCWATLKKSHFRIKVDRCGAAVGTISAAKEREIKTLCDWARESLDSAHFDARFAAVGSASTGIEAVKNDIVALLNEYNGAPCTGPEVHQFLAHFILVQFDFLREGAIDPPDAINRIRGCLAPDEAAKAPLVWSRVVRLARASAGKSGQFDRARLVRLLSPVARLRGANSLRLDLDKLAELARGYASFISIVGNDVDVIGSNVWSVDAGSLVDTDSYWHTPSGDVADSFRVKFPSLGALPGRYDRRFSVSSLIQFDGSQALSLGVEPYGARFVYGEPYPINPPTGVPDNSASALLLSAGLAGLTLLRRTVV